MSDPAERNASVSPGLREVILRLLERAPDRRYASSREALAALRERCGAADRSLELASFMGDLFPEAAAAARRSRTTLNEDAGELGAVWERAQAGASASSGKAKAEAEARARQPRIRRGVTLALAISVLLAAAGVAYLVVEILTREPSGPRAQAGAPVAAIRGGASMGAGARKAPRRAAPQQGASLDIASEPSGALILVDGVDTRRRTPARFGVRPGRHRVRVRWGSGFAAEQTRDLAAGHTARLRFQRPAPPSARFASAPASIGTKPASKMASTSGSASVSVSMAARPVGRLSHVRFTCKPWALVTFSGRSLGQTPRSRQLAQGRYHVTFRNPALGLTKRRAFRVRGDGRPLRVSCRF